MKQPVIEITDDPGVPSFFGDWVLTVRDGAAAIAFSRVDHVINTDWTIVADGGHRFGRFKYPDTWLADAFHRWSIFGMQWPAITYAAIVGRE